MFNSVDKRVVTKTIVLYAVSIVLVMYGLALFNKIPIIKQLPQLKAVLAMLLIVFVSFAKISTEFSFLICGILGSFVMGISLSKYTEYLFKQASSTSIFLIAVSGAVVAALARNDLLDKLNNTRSAIDKDNYIDVEQQASVFCLFFRLQKFIFKVNQKHGIIAFVVFLFQNMLLFVSSVVSAQTFSAMLKNDKAVQYKENNYKNAGILCMCVSGSLLMFFFMKSPWWLFFLGLAKDITIRFPAGVLLYAFFSFAHGYYLLAKDETFKTTDPKKKISTHPLTSRHFFIYIALIGIFLVFMLPKAVSYIGLAESAGSEYKQSIQATSAMVSTGKLSVQDGTGKIFEIIARGNYSASDYVTLGIAMIMLLILVGIISATVITRNIMKKNIFAPNQSSTINELKDLVLGDKGIKSVISTIVLIATILAFRDLVKECVDSTARLAVSTSGIKTGFDFFSQTGLPGLLVGLGCAVTIIVVLFTGRILGSNFGAFSIGWIVFGILSSQIPALNNEQIKRWMIENLIIVSTFCNQTSPQSSNAGMLISEFEKDSRNIQIKAWKVKSFKGFSALSIQAAGTVACIIISAIGTFSGLK